MTSPILPFTAHQYLLTLLQHHADPTHSQIHVKNLSFSALIGADPWGRPTPRQNIVQPVKLSARVSLLSPFSSASASDTVDSSTVHYGILSKAILKLVSNRSGAAGKTFQTDWSVNDLVDWLVVYMTGTAFGYPSGASKDSLAAAAWYDIEGGIPCLEKDAMYRPPLIKVSDLRELELEVGLEKGSLLSENVVLRKKVGFAAEGRDAFWSSCLLLEGLRVPCLIGVNTNERTARQWVTASIEIDPYVCKGRDCYPELEDIVFKTIEESSFETLESLALHVADRIIELFVLQYAPSDPTPRQDNEVTTLKALDAYKVPTTVRVKLAKPTAVTLADAPAIELTKTAVQDEGSESSEVGKRVPFPLDGRLDTWLAKN